MLNNTSQPEFEPLSSFLTEILKYLKEGSLLRHYTEEVFNAKMISCGWVSLSSKFQFNTVFAI